MLTTGKAWAFACIFLCLDNLTKGIVLEGIYKNSWDRFLSLKNKNWTSPVFILLSYDSEIQKLEEILFNYFLKTEMLKIQHHHSNSNSSSKK